MTATTWVDTQNSEQRRAARRNLKKVKAQEKEKVKSGLIRMPIYIKKGAILKYMTPLEAQAHIETGANVPSCIKKQVKKAIKTLDS